MIDKNKINEIFMRLKKVVYIEKDENDNIIYPTNKDSLRLYKEIVQSYVKSGNDQFYHKKNKVWYQVTSEAIEDPETKMVHKLEFFEDITKIKEAERKLKIDALTNLINDRNECNKIINEYIDDAIENQREFSIVMADLDYFKSINDTYGHACGDFVLGKIGTLLLSNTKQADDKFDYRNNDIVTRIGGDEFLILLKNISLDATKNKVEELSNEVSNLKIEYNGELIPIDMSFGYYHVDCSDMDKNINPEEIRQNISKKADDYLYINKNKKKERLGWKKR